MPLSVLHTFFGLVTVFLAFILEPTAAVLNNCGNARYDPTQYTCYPGSQPGLCPILNGVPTKPCGPACYSPYQYQCNSGQLNQLSADPNPFYLTAVHPGTAIHGKKIQATGLAFYIGPADPTTYCPASSLPPNTCPPPANLTIFGAGGGGLATIVPGGQLVYIETNGALAFTQAHSAATTNLLIYGIGGPIYEGGAAYGPNGADWLACPTTLGGAAVWQVFVHLPGVSFPASCIAFYAKTHDEAPGTVGAWQYT